MTSTLLTSQSTLASNQALTGHQDAYHGHQRTLNEDWGTLYRTGIPSKAHDTMPGPYLTLATQVTPHKHQSASKTCRRTEEEVDRYWHAFVTQEPLSDDMKALIRADLKKMWYFERFESFRDQLRVGWTTVDGERMILNDAFGGVEPGKLKFLCNKPTAFYWLQSAQEVDAYGQRTIMPKIILAAIFEEWTRSHRFELNIEYGHFFANPVRITATGPSTIQGVLDAHLSLCTQAYFLIDQARGRADNVIEPKPSTSQHYALSPLYHAIVVIMDYQLEVPKRRIESDGFISLRKFAQEQTVLIVRTGLEEGLSGPISFESLKSQSLPLDRPDAIMEGLDLIRVSLASAVHFIVNLEMRENNANSMSRDESSLDKSLHISGTPKGFDRQVCHNPETWVDAVMAAAEENGYDNDPSAWLSIRRVEASKIGEDFASLDYEPYRRKFRY